MDVKRMHCMIEKLSECAKEEFEKGIECVDTDEMGKVTDMLKDLAEAMYYRTLTNSMEESSTEEVLSMFDRYGDRRFYDHYRYADGRFAPKGRGTRRGYTEPPYYFQTPDMYHEWDSKSDAERGRDLDRMGGRMSGYDKAKRHYTESKEMHKGNSQADKEQKMRDLEAYMKELSGDVTEILSDMTPEERTLLKAKMTTLLQKIG